MSPVSSASHKPRAAAFVPSEPISRGDRSAVSAPDAREIDDLLYHGNPLLAFPRSLEARFQADTAPERLRTLIASGALVSILYNWLLLSDWMMIPDMFALALRLRLLFFTPLTVLGLFLLAKLPSPSWREAAIVLSGVVATYINVHLCLGSRDPLAGPYLVSVAVIVVFCSSVTRIRMRPALALDVIVMGLFFWGWHSIPGAPLEIMAPAALTLVSSVVFTLYGAYTQERDVRQNWLLLMRERLLQDEIRSANASLEEAARCDMLTDLASRHHFDARLQQMWDEARDDGSEISLMLVDIDQFKDYNASHGHPQGDACLQDVAGVLKRRLTRPQELIARFGGEEFIVAMVATPLQTAVGAAEIVRKDIEALQRPHGTPGHPVVTISVGVSCMRPNSPHSSVAQLIAVADEALHLAKKRGRNRVIAFGTQD